MEAGLSQYKDALGAFFALYPGPEVDVQILLSRCPQFATLLVQNPPLCLPVLQAAFGQPATLQLINVPPCLKKRVSALRSKEAVGLMGIEGTVVRIGLTRMLEKVRQYECAKCHTTWEVHSKPEEQNKMTIPKACVARGQCKSTTVHELKGNKVCCDYQLIKLQEQVSKLGVGSIPRSIMVILEGPLVDSVKAGDDVVVVGTLLKCWKPCIKDVRCDLETMLQASSIRVKSASGTTRALVTDDVRREFEAFWQMHAADPLAGRNCILASICPKVYGMFIVKLAVALTVIGGCAHVDATGMKTRGDSHMLLIGDPGTGKSQFLRFTAELSPRSVLTTGIGTTRHGGRLVKLKLTAAAGLTCTAVKDGGEWMLEAGALVLADRGVCCIDEFSSITAHDRASIHEAMEQQTLSVAKAGLVCQLNTRTTVFAVTNPKGRYDPNADVSVNTAIASPLLSRFDIILVLLDTVQRDWDRRVSSFILNQASTDEAIEDNDDASRLMAARIEDALKEEATPHRQQLWSVAKLQAYICYVKETFQPRLTREAMTVLQRYYQMQRSSDVRNAARTTIRLLESLTRISQAHAKLMCRHEVTVQDAVMAVYVTETSKSADSMFGYESVLHKNFAPDPLDEYHQIEYCILGHLSLVEYCAKPPPPEVPLDDYADDYNYEEHDANDGEEETKQIEVPVVPATQAHLENTQTRWSQALEARRSQKRRRES
ncbi:DNA replication licensing factor MCM9 [Achlya hypogyna]|uniref:DNA helicase n=1 Tax=Achlya hypogyna TaxID=1202772 RepID=A0A1V9Y9W4_ACHHY|nr:DNA replication licensing factor MCM9 [Achlya hypogyna]